MQGHDVASFGACCDVNKTAARRSIEGMGEDGRYVDFAPPWKECGAGNGEPLTAVDHFVSIDNVVVLDEEHMNEWLHSTQDSLQGDSHAFSRDRQTRGLHRNVVTSDCKCFSRPNGLSDCCLTNTSGQSMLADDSFPPPWVDHKSEDVPLRHAENWSYSCPSDANRSQLGPSTYKSADQLTDSKDCLHFDFGAEHKHQNRLHHHHNRHMYSHNRCSHLEGLQNLEQCDLKERVHTWLMGVDRCIPNFESINEIT